MNSAKALVHQALHGYEDGHRLLASSLPIKGADARRMLVLSDSPDARQIDPGTPLLCGYPLPDADLYVLALTWPAPEIRRPGCVWTHSFLLTASGLEAEDLTALLGAFSRPEASAEDWQRYRQPLALRGLGKSAPTYEAPEVAATTLWSLYEPPAPPIDLRSSALKGNDPHRLLLAIWLQQQPSLRHVFAFAQAPRTARRLDQQLFDLQLTSTPQQGTWEQAAELTKPRTVTRPLESRPPDWCAVLAEDLRSPGPLRTFLRDFSNVELASREGLWALASLFAALDPNRRTTLVDGIAALSHVCPHPDEGGELKQALLASEPDPRLPFSVDQLDVIFALFTSDWGEDPSLDLGSRIATLLREDDSLVLELTRRLFERRRTKTVKAAIEAIASNLTDAQVKRWAARDEELIAQLAAQSEELLNRRSLLPSLSFETAWPILGRSQMAKGKRFALLKGALRAGAGDFAAAAVASWPDATELLLDAIHATGSDAPTPKLLADAKSKIVVPWLQENGPSPAVAAALLNAWPAKKLEKVPVAEWDHLLEKGGDLNDFTLILLFLAATEPSSSLGPRTAIRTYDELFVRLGSKSKLKSKAINRLREAAPDQEVGLSEQAADLLAVGFLEGSWPADELLSISRPAALRQVLASSYAASLIPALIPALDDSEASKQHGEIVWDALFASKDISLIKKTLTPIREAILWPSRFLKL